LSRGIDPLLPNEWIEIAKLRHPGVGIRLTAHEPSGVLSVARKQSGRGFTFDYLAMPIAVVLSNLNRIVTFFVDEEDLASTDKERHRAHRQPDPSKRQPPNPHNPDSFSPPKAGLLVANEENNPIATLQKHTATTTKKDRPRFSANPICFLQFHEDLKIIH